MEYSLTRPPFSLPSPTSPSIAALSAGLSSPSGLSVENVIPKKRSTKSHVPAACINCQRAHLACDLARPCKRCVQSGRKDTCFDVQHKKRGRPKRCERRTSASAMGTSSSGYKLQIFPPGLPQSTFLMTRPPDNNTARNDPSKNKSLLTFFLSMDVCCARVSDESLNILGIYPHEFAHRSLYDFIVPEHASRLARIHRRLLDNANNRTSPSGEKQVLPPTQRTTAECFSSTPSTTLLSIANGSQTFNESISFRSVTGAELVTDAQFYLGGGLGSDLFMPGTLSQLYVVCIAATEPRLAEEPAPSSAPDSSNLAQMLNLSPRLLPSSATMRDPGNEAEYADRFPFQHTPGEGPRESASPVLLLHEAATSTNYISSSHLLGMSPSSIDISNSPASTSSAAAAVNTTSLVTAMSVTQPTQPSRQHPPQPHDHLSVHQISPQVHQQLLNRYEKTASPPSRPNLIPDRTSLRLPRVKQQFCDSLAAALDQQQDQRAHERSRACNTWSHPREAYFREIGSSRLGSVDTNSSGSFPYQSPSYAMMDAIRHSTKNQISSCSLNPVATHHRIPSIHSRVPSLRPFAHTRARH